MRVKSAAALNVKIPAAMSPKMICLLPVQVLSQSKTGSCANLTQLYKPVTLEYSARNATVFENVPVDGFIY